jgi:hypothetical protein
MFPKRDEERRLLAAYQAEDTAAAPEAPETPPAPVTAVPDS